MPDEDKSPSVVQLGPERVGRVGFSVLVLAVLASAVLAINSYVKRPTNAVPLGGRHVAAAGRSPTKTTSTAGDATGPLLSTETYAHYAYEIYPGPLSAQTKGYTAGYVIDIKPHGSLLQVNVRVPASGAELKGVYAGTDKVYIVEAAPGDDSGGSDYSSGDDGFIVTTISGHVIS